MSDDEIPMPPEGWHEENKSDVPEEELDGVEEDDA